MSVFKASTKRDDYDAAQAMGVSPRTAKAYRLGERALQRRRERMVTVWLRLSSSLYTAAERCIRLAKFCARRADARTLRAMMRTRRNAL